MECLLYGQKIYPAVRGAHAGRAAGQREEPALGGLYDYGARFYDPLLGRFLSADSVVPGAGNPQALNRYAYVLNRPTVMIDPSGHAGCAASDNACWQNEWNWQNRWYEAHGYFWSNGGWNRQGLANFCDEGILRDTVAEVGITFVNSILGSWDFANGEMQLLGQGVVALANKLGGLAGFAQLKSLFGSATSFVREHINLSTAAAFVGNGAMGRSVGIPGDTHSVTFWDGAFGSADYTRGIVVHELGHVMDSNCGECFSKNMPFSLQAYFYTRDYSHDDPYERFADALAYWVFDSPIGNPYRAAMQQKPRALPGEFDVFMTAQLMVQR